MNTTAGKPTCGVPAPQASTLNTRFVSHGMKFFGASADQNTINIPANVAILEAQFGAVTPENSMTWAITEVSGPGDYNFTASDFIVNWAVTNAKMIRGYTIIWHTELPGWVNSITDPVFLTEVLSEHIGTVATRYQGELYCDEILNEDGSLQSNVFSNLLGQNFVKLAFQFARQADPNAKLYINDFNLDSPNAKVNGMINLVKSINAVPFLGSLLIDGIGTQVHLNAGGAGGVRTALLALASSGVSEIAITELDIAGADPNDYTTVVEACLATPSCVSITTWGVADVNSARASVAPLLFDNNYQPKPAFNAILNDL
ncbi:putative xylanase [Mycena floridula]|nr:putative xylanase [Mycena floridula]